MRLFLIGLMIWMLGCASPKQGAVQEDDPQRCSVNERESACIARQWKMLLDAGLIKTPHVAVPVESHPCVKGETMTSCVTRLQNRIDRLEKRLNALEQQNWCANADRSKCADESSDLLEERQRKAKSITDLMEQIAPTPK